MAEKLPEKRQVAGRNGDHPTRREALAKLGLISATTLFAAEILTLSSNKAHAGPKKSCKGGCSSRSRSRSRLKGPSEIDVTFCDLPNTDVFCTN